MAGFMIDNIAKGTLKQWHLEDMDKISKDKDVVLLDVRTVGAVSYTHLDVYKRQMEVHNLHRICIRIFQTQ